MVPVVRIVNELTVYYVHSDMGECYTSCFFSQSSLVPLIKDVCLTFSLSVLYFNCLKRNWFICMFRSQVQCIVLKQGTGVFLSCNV